MIRSRGGSFVATFLILLTLSVNGQIQAQTGFWERTNGPFGGYISALAIDSTGTLYAGTTGGVFRSNDNGNTWVRSITA